MAVHEQNLEKHIEKHMGGCMAGFFNLFDRNYLLSGKRLYPKRLPPLTGDSSSEPVSLVESPAVLREFEKPLPEMSSSAPVKVKDDTPVTPPPNSPSPVGASTFEFKKAVKSPWKFAREVPRLSLDSRAVTDAKGGLRPREIRVSNTAADDEERESNQRWSPSVVARLMGLEPISSSTTTEAEPAENKVELRRSVSESRSRDYNRFLEASLSIARNEAVERKLDHHHHLGGGFMNSSSSIGLKCKGNNNDNVRIMRNKQQNQSKSMVERRYYDSADFFPQKEQHHQTVTIYGEIERRLRMRGIDEPAKDLETLKHILEALQLKGLLHSSSTPANVTSTTTTPATRMRHNVVYDRRDESPIVLMRPGNRQRSDNNGLSPKRERQARSPMRSPRGENRGSSLGLRQKGGAVSVETREGNETRRAHSPIQSRMRRVDHTVSRSPRSRRPTTVDIYQGDINRVQCGGLAFAEDGVSSTLSESSFTTSSPADNERWRVEYRDGRNLLDRCGKLLHSIAEITSHSSSNSNSNSTELQQPSPVSVLDSSFYKEDESSPSPVKKRTVHFEDQGVMELQDELWSPSSSTTRSLKLDNDFDSADESEFSYVSEVVRASNYFPDDTNLFSLLEKQGGSRGFGRDKAKVSILQRKLIFDSITEILNRNRLLPPWKAVLSTGKCMTEQVWLEFQKMRERGPSEDLFEVICGVLKKDMSGDSINGWGDSSIEMSETVLVLEQLIFKDLIGEAIRDLAALAGRSAGLQAPRRKLVF